MKTQVKISWKGQSTALARCQTWNFPYLPPGGGEDAHHAPCHVFAYICAHTGTNVLKNLDFSQFWVWKMKISHFVKKKIKLIRNTRILLGTPLKSGSNASPNDQKIQKSNSSLEGFRHSNFINPFEYMINSSTTKSLPKRIWTLTL